MARGRKPIDYKTASPTNPYNNAGPKVKATSRTGASATKKVLAAMDREAKRAPNVRSVSEAGAGMQRKNAQAAAKASYNRVVGETPKQRAAVAAKWPQKSITGPKAPYATKSGVNAYTRYNKAVSAIKSAASSPTAKKVAGAVGSAASSFMNKAGLVGMAGQVGYAIGTEINNHTKAASKLAAAFSPDYDPGTYKLNKDSGQAYKTKRK